MCAKVETYREAGLEHFFATLFVGTTVDELIDQMRLFARHVMPAFQPSAVHSPVSGAPGSLPRK